MKTTTGFPPFRARPPWWGGDLQTLRGYVLRRLPSLDGYSAEQMGFPMSDGSGDTLLATLNRPKRATRRPLVILIHGLTGCEDSRYMRASAAHFLSLGYPVLRLNLRGAGPSRNHCQYHYHAGHSADLRTVIGQMDGRLAANGLFLIGYSLGGNMLLKHLGEEGRRALVLGAASISAPIDLKAAQRRMMALRNRAYHAYILGRMKVEFGPFMTAAGAHLADLAAIRSIYAFDDRLVAPRNGFAGAEDYYARSMALQFLPEIRVPTLVIHARNDPWIPIDSYLGFDWASNPKLVPLLPKGGGHVGFSGVGGKAAWHDRCIARFFGSLAG
ncbi:YheT family hydrolase [Virgifigura deserti]|uniref:YheT family hydrolase n=1 Tax=Virgifigura deserti TaxID=2268457 RepID=UPI003CCBAD6B